jgi:hypothetical protein
MIKKAIYKFNQLFLSGSNRSVFIVCFLISSLFWYLIKFSKEYTHYIDYTVELVNIPIDKYVKETSGNVLKIKVNGFGFSFLRQILKSRNLKVDFSKLQSHGTPNSSYFWVSQSENANFAQELNTFSILDIEPDTLFVKFSSKTKKSLQIKVLSDFKYKESYAAYGSFKVSPSFVDVYGPSHILDTVSFIYTDNFIQTEVFEDIQKVLPLHLPSDLISSKIKEVEIIQGVARYTQMNLSIPIDLKNIPKGKKLKIKPAKVDLTYWVALKDIEKVTSSDFKLYCDYNESDMTKSAVLNVFLDRKNLPSIVQRVKFHPSTIEFIKMN